MLCSVWRFRGDPDAMEGGYRALMGRVPASNHVLHAAARTPDGLLIFDLCPSEEAYHAFLGSDEVRAMFADTGSRAASSRTSPSCSRSQGGPR